MIISMEMAAARLQIQRSCFRFHVYSIEILLLKKIFYVNFDGNYKSVNFP